MMRKTILVADDSKAATDLYSARFKQEGITTLVAGNGTACLQVLKAIKPDLLLLDVQMPDMDGAEVMEFIMQDEGLRGIPVIVLSATVQPQHSGMMLHGITYLSKMIGIDKIVSSVKEELAKQPGPGNMQAGTANAQMPYPNLLH
jgi:CheY-like chemotaxis protein